MVQTLGQPATVAADRARIEAVEQRKHRQRNQQREPEVGDYLSKLARHLHEKRPNQASTVGL